MFYIITRIYKTLPTINSDSIAKSMAGVPDNIFDSSEKALQKTFFAFCWWHLFIPYEIETFNIDTENHVISVLAPWAAIIITTVISLGLYPLFNLILCALRLIPLLLDLFYYIFLAIFGLVAAIYFYIVTLVALSIIFVLTWIISKLFGAEIANRVDRFLENIGGFLFIELPAYILLMTFMILWIGYCIVKYTLLFVIHPIETLCQFEKLLSQYEITRIWVKPIVTILRIIFSCVFRPLKLSSEILAVEPANIKNNICLKRGLVLLLGLLIVTSWLAIFIFIPTVMPALLSVVFGSKIALMLSLFFSHIVHSAIIAHTLGFLGSHITHAVSGVIAKITHYHLHTTAVTQTAAAAFTLYALGGTANFFTRNQKPTVATQAVEQLLPSAENS